MNRRKSEAKASTALLLGLLVVVSLAMGCSRLVVVPGPGKTDQEFRQDRYECIKESSHRGWGFGAGGYSASGWGGERVNEDQFYACMEVRGHLTRRQNKITGSLSEP